MNPIDILIFRNFSSFNEPAITFGFGYMSFRNLIVLGIFGAVSGILYKLILPINIELERDLIPIIITVIPIIFGMTLAMMKPQLGTADSILCSILHLYTTKNKKKKIEIKSNKNSKNKSNVLKFAEKMKSEKVPDSDIVKMVTCADFDELKSIKITLRTGSGELLINKLVKCYLDDILFDTINTSLDGVIELKIQPKTAGKKLLVIKDEDDIIINKKSFLFKRK